MIGVVCAHPDDEILGMGGTIARHIAEGESVSVLYLGRGREGGQQVEGAVRAAGALGFSPVFVGDLFPDNQMDTVPLIRIIHAVEAWIKAHEPHIVYTHHRSDLNVDHRAVFEAVLTATRPGYADPLQALYSFEVLSSTEWAFDYSFRPARFVDVSQYWQEKVAGLRCYESEMRPFPHPRSFRALEARAQYWGAVVGVEYAEAFEVVRMIE
ncbi:hypothetical protein LCGC14_0313230 [marine sediment metagenome]|uniref:GlcNAc-PI de-N-acetylase n=1 Tax=marine sediment metagenome TaxID=412755 RepID=A0A0F9W8P9_9ZZZZ